MNYDFNEVVDRSKSKSRKWAKEILKKNFGREDILPMWIADMDFKCAPPIVDRMLEVSRHGIYGYTFVPDEYYSAVVSWCKRRHHWDIKKEWITFTHGTVSTLHYIVQEFCNPGDKVIVQTPGYEPFENAVKRHGAILVKNPLRLQDGKYTIDFDDLEKKAKDAKIMIFCSPHNPTGRVWSLEELKKVSEICLNNNVLMVVDEIHKDIILYNNEHISFTKVSKEAADNCIVCVSPNKAFNLGGLKSSYTVIPNENIRERLQRRLEINSITSPNIFAVPALIAAYTECDEWLDQLIKYIEGNFNYVKEYLEENIPYAKLIEPQATYLAWIDMRDIGKDFDQLRDLIINKAKVGVNFGTEFIDNGRGFIRMNLGCPRYIVEEAMKRINSVI
ncbi:MalY/PatB family protein [Thermoanaerobacterium thermosaccharolyticum]|uniref:cysteine-S-conjugate beta-lyase n=1 Tax=Thermoanaerobacterium thermosaccharolyticum M0795 TaxID=698948 RepID=L0IKR1_THETR|nr:MalY/PatB family protein [Thermoanaerobacterium thermosaccharolyticum]AGB19334.1 bifunctional PLP-dependent enzyme with beta-cystathionase and maltose regulon repressor activities [Thermoanaerobacterium thermosaccharolyticum M0795]